MPPPPPPPSGGGRSDLLSQIQSGTSLKKVDSSDRNGSGDGRTNLLSDIRSGVKLRTVSWYNNKEAFVTINLRQIITFTCLVSGSLAYSHSSYRLRSSAYFSLILKATKERTAPEI